MKTMAHGKLQSLLTAMKSKAGYTTEITLEAHDKGKKTIENES
ncbi:hypothetical protein MEC_00861 [Bartonella alsatica IBS 382]|uniref:Uncharacterized protein n=1 Tax=Bartonella alsatica IBS 382 TaxID=1094551 RepID=J1IW19_9HYPH|nr:hypothetical protein MEC_00861 [Bartonella alsatica IBS 382]